MLYENIPNVKKYYLNGKWVLCFYCGGTNLLTF
jgi:hypothetical protein